MSKRRVVCSANKCPKTDRLIIGARHWDNSMRKHYQLYLESGLFDDEGFTQQGFIDQHGVFMDRQEAWKVAHEAGQVIKRVGGDDANGGTLYSENLY